MEKKELFHDMLIFLDAPVFTFMVFANNVIIRTILSKHLVLFDWYTVVAN